MLLGKSAPQVVYQYRKIVKQNYKCHDVPCASDRHHRHVSKVKVCMVHACLNAM